jgi:hypothetical protein
MSLRSGRGSRVLGAGGVLVGMLDLDPEM